MNQNQGLAQQPLSGLAQGNQFFTSLEEQQRQFNESLQFQKDQQPSFFDNLLNIGASVGGNLVGGIGNPFAKSKSGLENDREYGMNWRG